MVRAIVKKGKEITPRRRAAIVTLRCLKIPMTFKKIKDITGVSTSTVSDIWRHALANARSAQLAVTTITPVPTTLPPTTPLASPSAAPSAAALSATAHLCTIPQAPVLTVLPPTSTPTQISIPGPSSTLISDKEFSLMELISASVLDSDPHSGRPSSLSESDKDKFVKLVKKDFITRRMTLCDIQREADLSHMCKTTVFRALQERGIGMYPEVFKFILSKENQKKRLAGWWPAEQWANYAFTDEMSIEIGGLYRPCLIWREKSERWADDCIGAKKKQGASIMCWGMISYGWKGPFWVWESETEEEKVTATSKILRYNENCGEEESRLNTAWRASEEWKESPREELANAHEAHLLASLAGVKTKTTQSWRGKKFKIKKLKRGDSKGIDSWQYVTDLARPLLWPTCLARKLVCPDFLLMEDNAPAHDSDFTNYKRTKERMNKVDWPPNSPDLNPIEHL
ncbi:hypothetical protein L873DRAFT_1897545 [Choiromyces venosus 120613-1]|uniref:Tc1-like transposase DDE domain-containing protein n=1 Tax=Choiromyces venosus 120613-1 TaxID=1336337 RepID=A0A3N4JTJ1_9PEZI|nr:hypothetical protein L873DRAFT_1897545 [Choiromyces venosus 120613-1]